MAAHLMQTSFGWNTQEVPLATELCDSPIDGSQADLCQQWRSANAAEYSGESARWSVLLSLAGLAGLLYTVYLTNKATKAATAATEAAVRSANSSERAYVSQHRPWLKFSSQTRVRLIFLEEGGLPEVLADMECENVGQAPAYILDTNATAEISAFRRFNAGTIVKNYAAECVSATADAHDRRVVFPGDKVRLVAPVIDFSVKAVEGQRYVYLMACITYSMGGVAQRFHLAEGLGFDFADTERSADADASSNLLVGSWHSYDGISAG